MASPETWTERNKDLRVGRFSLKAAVGAFFLFGGLALAALVAGAASWRTQVGRLGVLIVLSTLPFASVALLLQQRNLDVYRRTGYSAYRWPVRIVERACATWIASAPCLCRPLPLSFVRPLRPRPHLPRP